jgi:hypothetical protein
MLPPVPGQEQRATSEYCYHIKNYTLVRPESVE